MLRQVLHEVEAAEGPVSLNELSRKLGLEPGALEGMLDFWVRKGRLLAGARHEPAGESVTPACAAGGCGWSCPGPQSCPLVMKLPRTYAAAARHGIARNGS